MKLGSRVRGLTSVEGEQSWHTLKKKRGTRAGVQTKPGRKRRRVRLLRQLTLFVFVGLVIGALVRYGYSVSNNKSSGLDAAYSKPIASVNYETNGVLSYQWLNDIIQVTMGAPLVDVDIHGIKAKLEAVGQVSKATIERQLPDVLSVRIIEFEPVLRFVTQDTNGKKHLHLIDRTGVIYDGIGYARERLSKLPYLSPYITSKGTYSPLIGIETVADLLKKCEESYPEEYAGWWEVILHNYTGNPDLPGEVIEIKTKVGATGTRLIFGASVDFGLQLDRLSHIKAVAAGLGDPLLQVDLSLKDAAAVKFKSGRNKLY